MSAQPANTDIQVFQRLRSYRQDLRHDSVEAITKRLRKLILSVPGKEVLSGVLTRDSSLKDFSAYSHDGSLNFGFPIVIGLNKVETFADAQEHLPNIDFAFQIGRDKFLQNVSTVLSTEDLQGDARSRLVAAGVDAPG